MSNTSFTITRNPLTGSTANLVYILGWGRGSDANAGTIDSPKATIDPATGTKIIRGKLQQDFANINNASQTWYVGEQDGEIDGIMQVDGLFNFWGLKIKNLLGSRLED